MKKTKRSLITSIVTLLLCSCMFVGSTFAWFTDTVSNTGNKIQAGTLDIGLEQFKVTPTAEAGEWVDLEEEPEPIFNYGLWEPGYSDVALLKVTNKGNLAFKYVLNIKQGIDPTTGEQSALEVNEKGHTLADAIWVYSKVGETTIPTAIPAEAEIDNTNPTAWHKTLLKDALAETDSAVHGVLLPNTSTDETPTTNSYATMAVILHMDEQAGNEYQGLSLGTSFDIELRATQCTYEKDGFGSDQYDALANGTPDHPEFDVPSYPVTKLPINTTVVKEDGGTTYEVTRGEQTIKLPSGMTIKYPDGVRLTTTPTTSEEGASTNKADQGFEFVSEEPAPASTNVKLLVESDPNKAVAQYKLTLPVDQSNNIILVKATDKIASGYIGLKVFHNDVEINKVNADATPTNESFYYNPETGDFVLWVYHASPIEFVYLNECKHEGAIWQMTPTTHSTHCDVCDKTISGEHTFVNGVCSVCGYKTDAKLLEENPKYVCRNNNEGYEHVFMEKLGDTDSAVKNVKSGDTIILLKDYSTTNGATQHNLGNDCSITLDLNGKKLSYPSSIQFGPAELNIIDSSVSGTGEFTGISAFCSVSHSETETLVNKVNVYGGKIKTVSSGGGKSNKIVNIYGGEVEKLEVQGTDSPFTDSATIYGGNVKYISIHVSAALTINDITEDNFVEVIGPDKIAYYGSEWMANAYHLYTISK